MLKVLSLLLASVLLMGISDCSDDKDNNKGPGSLADGSFKGLFVGEGDIVVNGMSVDCDRMVIQIDTDDETFFNVEMWEYTCDGLTGENDPVRAQVVDGRVIVGDRDIGSFVNSTISLAVNENGESWSLQASAFDDRMEIREAFSSGEYQIVATGNLLKISDGENAINWAGPKPIKSKDSRPGWIARGLVSIANGL